MFRYLDSQHPAKLPQINEIHDEPTDTTQDSTAGPLLKSADGHKEYNWKWKRNGKVFSISRFRRKKYRPSDPHGMKAIGEGWEVLEFSPPPEILQNKDHPPSRDSGQNLSAIAAASFALNAAIVTNDHLYSGSIEERPLHRIFAETEIFVVFFLALLIMLIAQVMLHVWKKHHHRSYHIVSLIFVWIFPAICAIQFHLWEILAIWCAFSGVTVWLIFSAVQRPMDKSTPRIVCQWFTAVHRLSMFLGCLGYFVFMVNVLFLLGGDEKKLSPIGYILFCHGLYYGLIGRDFAEVCVDCMCSRIGFIGTRKERSRVKHLSPDTCAICNQLLPHEEFMESQFEPERTVTLSCKHSYHELCLRGWSIVGKRDVCPYCAEKVDYRGVFRNPWESQSFVWVQVLDALRYFVVWNPLIIITLQLTLYIVKRSGVELSVV